jgi:hypothetical protein
MIKERNLLHSVNRFNYTRSAPIVIDQQYSPSRLALVVFHTHGLLLRLLHRWRRDLAHVCRLDLPERSSGDWGGHQSTPDAPYWPSLNRLPCLCHRRTDNHLSWDRTKCTRRSPREGITFNWLGFDGFNNGGLTNASQQLPSAMRASSVASMARTIGSTSANTQMPKAIFVILAVFSIIFSECDQMNFSSPCAIKSTTLTYISTIRAP